jgi:hypothetical protein
MDKHIAGQDPYAFPEPPELATLWQTPVFTLDSAMGLFLPQ